MKKLLLLILVIGVAWIGITYLSTGRMPWQSISAEEQQVIDLRMELGTIRQQWASAGRASTFGMDTSGITDAPVEKLQRLEQRLKDLNARLKTPEARNLAGALQRDIATFKSEMR